MGKNELSPFIRAFLISSSRHFKENKGAFIVFDSEGIADYLIAAVDDLSVTVQFRCALDDLELSREEVLRFANTVNAQWFGKCCLYLHESGALCCVFRQTNLSVKSEIPLFVMESESIWVEIIKDLIELKRAG